MKSVLRFDRKKFKIYRNKDDVIILNQNISVAYGTFFFQKIDIQIQMQNFLVKDRLPWILRL